MQAYPKLSRPTDCIAVPLTVHSQELGALSIALGAPSAWKPPSLPFILPLLRLGIMPHLCVATELGTHIW